MTGLRKSFFLATLVLLIAGCQDDPEGAWDGWESYGEPGRWPVSKVVHEAGSHRTSVYPVAEKGWQSLVDLSALAGFQPGMTGEDAVRRVGQADEYREVDGERYWIYQRPGASVVVARKMKASLIGGWWWRLEARYNPPLRPTELLHASVVEELPENLERHTVVIMNQDSEGSIPAAWVSIENGKIVRIDVSPSGAEGVLLGQSPDLK